jgi:serine/threonine protein kinase
MIVTKWVAKGKDESEHHVIPSPRCEVDMMVILSNCVFVCCVQLENVLCVSDAKYTIVKLADFGMGRHAGGAMITVCGTPGYLAPEILKNKNPRLMSSYTQKVDCWSLGVLLYRL